MDDVKIVTDNPETHSFLIASFKCYLVEHSRWCSKNAAAPGPDPLDLFRKLSLDKVPDSDLEAALARVPPSSVFDADKVREMRIEQLINGKTGATAKPRYNTHNQRYVRTNIYNYTYYCI